MALQFNTEEEAKEWLRQVKQTGSQPKTETKTLNELLDDEPQAATSQPGSVPPKPMPTKPPVDENDEIRQIYRQSREHSRLRNNAPATPTHQSEPTYHQQLVREQRWDVVGGIQKTVTAAALIVPVIGVAWFMATGAGEDYVLDMLGGAALGLFFGLVAAGATTLIFTLGISPILRVLGVPNGGTRLTTKMVRSDEPEYQRKPEPYVPTKLVDLPDDEPEPVVIVQQQAPERGVQDWVKENPGIALGAALIGYGALKSD